VQNCKPLEPWEGVVGGLHRLEDREPGNGCRCSAMGRDGLAANRPIA
jgi:hypothetical protein